MGPEDQGGIAFIDTAPFHQASPTLVRVVKHGVMEFHEKGQRYGYKYVYLEHTPGQQWLSLRAYQSDGPNTAGVNSRVPDWPEHGERIWSLHADNTVAWAIWPTSATDSCITIEKV